MECIICFSTFGDDAEEFVVKCPAAHRFCRNCLAMHAASRRFPRCPGEGCKYELSEAEVKDLCGEDSECLENLRADTLNRAIDGLGRIVRCPNPSCSNAVVCDVGSGRQRIECSCGWPAWCTCCRQPYHYHVECGEVQPRRQRWLEWVSGGRAAYHQESVVHEATTRQRVALEEATSRHTDLQQDESWKAANCRECPRCGRCVQKMMGCDHMVCGEDAHGGNRQSGCGHKFHWGYAKPYRAVQEAKPMPRLDAAEVRLKGAGLRHAFCKCSACNEEIIGPRFRCIHCPDFNLCVSCDRGRSMVNHADDHVFEIHFKAEYDLNSFLQVGSAVTVADESHQHGWEAVVLQKVCDDVYNVKLMADKSTKLVHRSGLNVRLASPAELAQHVEHQIQEEENLKAANAAAVRKSKIERAQAITAMKEEACTVQ